MADVFTLTGFGNVSGYRRISQRAAVAMRRRLVGAKKHGTRRVIWTYVGDINFDWLYERIRIIEQFGCIAIVQVDNWSSEKHRISLIAVQVTDA